MFEAIRRVQIFSQSAQREDTSNRMITEKATVEDRNKIQIMLTSAASPQVIFENPHIHYYDLRVRLIQRISVFVEYVSRRLLLRTQ